MNDLHQVGWYIEKKTSQKCSQEYEMQDLNRKLFGKIALFQNN